MKEDFVIKLLNDDHRCSRTPRNRQSSSTWITNNFLEKFEMNQNWKVEEMMREINEKFGIIVSRQTCYKARCVARKKLQGSLNDHFHLLPSYVTELNKVNRNSTFELVLDRDTLDGLIRFKRLYICFDSLARGFLEGCRKVIGLDGCFLKTKTEGKLLSGVGKDGNIKCSQLLGQLLKGRIRLLGLGSFNSSWGI